MASPAPIPGPVPAPQVPAPQLPGPLLPAARVVAAAEQRGEEVRTLAATGTLNLAGVVVGGLLNLSVTVVVTRGFALGRAGLLLEGISLYSMARTVGTLGGDTGLLRELPRLVALGRRDAVARTVLAALLPVCLVCALIAGTGVAFAGPLARALDHGARPSAQDILYLRLIVSSLALASPALIALAALRALGRVRSYVVLENLTKPFLRAFGAVLVVTSAAGEVALGVSYVLPVLIGLLGSAVLLRRLLRAGPTAGVAPPLPVVLRRFWAFAAARGLAATFAVVVSYADILLVGALRGARQATLYAAVSRCVMTATVGLHAVRVAIGPQFSRLLTQGRQRDAEHVYQVATNWLVWMSWPLFLVLGVYPAPVLRLFGSHYPAGAAALSVLAAAELVDMGVGNVTLYLLMGGKSSWNLVNTGVALMLNLTLNLLLIPRLGILGAAAAWAASIVVENLLALLEVWRLLGVSPFARSWFPTAGWALVCFGLVPGCTRLAWGGTSGTGLGLALLVAGPLYAGLTYRRRAGLQLSLLAGRSLRRSALADQFSGPRPPSQ